MKKRRSNIVIVILSILALALCTSGIYLLLKKNKSVDCSNVYKEYNFVSDFASSCDQTTFELEGIAYNIKEYENSYEMDLNVWDKENDKYYKTLQLQKNNGTLNISNIIPAGYYAIDIKVEYQEEKNLLSKRITFKNWEIKEKNYTEEEINKIANTIYNAISTTPLKTYNASKYLPYTTADRKNDILDAGKSSGMDNKTLYKPWIESYLSKQDKIKIDNLSKLSPFETIQNMDKETAEINEQAAKETGKDCYTEEERLDSYENTRSYGCLLIEQMYQNSGNSTYFETAKDKYCRLQSIKNDIETNKKLKYQYSDTDLTQAINIERLEKYNQRKSPDTSLPSTNTVSLFADLKSASNLYKDKAMLTSMNEIKTYIINSIIWEKQTNIESICSLSYSMNVNEAYKDTDFSKSINNGIESVLANNGEKSIQLMYDNVYALIMCKESLYKNTKENLKTLFKAEIYKILSRNIYDDNEKIGLWNNKDSYDIKTNARMLKLLIDEYENI